MEPLELGDPRWNQQIANLLLRYARDLRTGKLPPGVLFACLTAMCNALAERLNAVAVEDESREFTHVFSKPRADDPAYR